MNNDFAKKRGDFISVAVRVLVVIFLLGLVTLILYNYVKINELTIEQNKLEKTLEQLESEEQRLNIKLESKLDLKNIEKIAKEELGMSKIESSQKEYISIDNADTIRVIKKKEDNSVVSNALSEIMTSFSIIMEYLK